MALEHDDEALDTLDRSCKPAAPHRRKLLTAMIAGSAVLALGGGGAVAWQVLAPAPQAKAEVKAPKTETAKEAPLTWAVRASGTVGYTEQREFPAPLGGVLTELPAPGTVLRSGDVLYRVDDRPVFFLNGATPAWREFAPGMEDGPDVKQLEQVLADLGYFGGWVDESFTDLTTQAIKAWQKANGMKEDGVIPKGGIVFGTGAIRVGTAKTTTGQIVEPGTVLYEASGATAVVNAEIPVADRASVPVGAVATFSLPNGEQATGKVSRIGDPTEKEDPSGRKRVVVPVTITPDEPKKLDGQNALSVQLSFAQQAKGEVLQVPVSSLLAASDTAFEVEVFTGKRTIRIPVTVGRFASGMVEVTGGKLKAGDRVVVPG